MNLTARLKNWLIQNAGVEATATDDQFKKAAGEVLISGDLSPKKLAELTTNKAAEEADEFVSTFTELKEVLGDLQKSLNEPDDDEEEDEIPAAKSKTKTATKGKMPPQFAKKEDDAEEEADDEEEEEKPAKKSATLNTTKKAGWLENMVTRMGGTPDDDGEEKSFDIRVKSAVEQYTDTKSALHYPEVSKSGKAHPLAGKQVMDYNESGKGRSLNTASEKDMAIAGAWGQYITKLAVVKSRRLAFESLPDHSKNLVMHALQHESWGGASDGGMDADIKNRKLTPREQKAVIDDATSGGIEAAPIVFDDMIITTPLLYGELYPLVNTIPLDRGRRIEGVASGTVTGSWGGVDDTSIALFDTTSYITAFDTTIFRWEGSVRIGLDFLSDTPLDFGAQLTAQYGERLLEDLDDVIATGNGTTQPEGITVKSGTTSVAWSGSTSLGNYESLRFGVAKPEHRANVAGSAVFCGTETSYQRARAIPVGASDARRLGGPAAGSLGGVTDYGSYSWMGLPYKINESLGNTKVFYAILARYRMYRRRGLTMRTSTEGDTLIRKNEMLLVAMARYGGQLERGACAAVTSTAPA